MKLTPFSDESILGIDLGASAVKVVEAKFSFNKPVVLRAACQQVNFDKNADPEEKRAAYVAALRNILSQNKIGTKDAVISLPTASAVVRIIKFPDSGGEKYYGTGLLARGPAEAAFEGEDRETYTQPLDGTDRDGKPDKGVLLISGPRGAIMERVAIAREAGLNPIVADVDIFAVLNQYMLARKPEKKELLVMLDMGAGTTDIAIVENGMTKLVRTVFVAGANFTRTLQRELDVTMPAAETLKKKHGLTGKRLAAEKKAAPGKPLSEEEELAVKIYGLLAGQVEQITTEISRSISYFTEKMKDPDMHISKVALTGGSSEMPGLVDHLAEELGAPVETFRPLGINGGQICPCLPALATAAGLSLRSVPDRTKLITRVNLLPESMVREALPPSRRSLYMIGFAVLLAFYSGYLRLSERSEARLKLRAEALLAETAKLEKAKSRGHKNKAARTGTAPGRAEVNPADENQALITTLKVTGIFADATAASAILAGHSRAYLAKDGKLTDADGKVVPGIATAISRKSVTLSAGGKDYVLTMPE